MNFDELLTRTVTAAVTVGVNNSSTFTAVDVAKVVGASPAGLSFPGRLSFHRHVDVDETRSRTGPRGLNASGDRRWRWVAGETAQEPRSAVDAIALMDGVNGNYFGGVRKGQGRGSGRPGMSCAVDRALGVGAQSSARRNCFVVPVPWYTHRAQVKNLSNMTLVMCTID